MFIPIERRTLVLKMVIRVVFLMKPKHQSHLSQWGECVYSAQSRKDRWLLWESMFIPTERRTSILKMLIRDVFLMKPRHQYLWSQRGECVYGTQSWKEKRLWCENKFIPIERWTSILRMVIREVFLLKQKHQYH